MPDHDPRGVRVDDLLLPTRDGCRLHVRVWRPEGAGPLPAVVEANPYGEQADDDPRHRWLATNGYVGVRLDLRGTHGSEGTPQDEYTAGEHDDIADVLAALAREPWCDGRFGMIGVSWSGFNALQMAAYGPPGLRAVVSICSTDDRYADDVHYIGGCVLASEMLNWSTIMLAIHATPPAAVGADGDWIARWRERLEAQPHLVETWLAHQRRDAYWRQGSVADDAAAVRIPVLMVGGWEDGYARGALRATARIERAWGLVGPWAHCWPYRGSPGPAIAFLHEMRRWFDRWLKDVPNGYEDEPRLRAYVRGPRSPLPYPAEEPGRWVGVPGWRDDLRSTTFGLDAAMLGLPGVGSSVSLRGQQSAGLETPAFCPYGDARDVAGDQRGEDGRWLSFTTAPLSSPIDVLGLPVVELDVSADRPQAAVGVRFCHVLADGASRLLCVGALNLTHRDGHVEPRAVIPGQRMRIRVGLRAVGQHIPAGDRLRVAVSPTFWPWLWPSPEPVTLTVHLDGGNRLLLPTLDADAAVDVSFAGSDMPADEEASGDGDGDRGYRRVELSLGTGRVALVNDLGDWVGGPGSSYRERYEIVDDDPLSAAVACTGRSAWRRGEETAAVDVEATMRATPDAFLVDGRLVARLGGEVVHERSLRFQAPRDQV